MSTLLVVGALSCSPGCRSIARYGWAPGDAGPDGLAFDAPRADAGAPRADAPRADADAPRPDALADLPPPDLPSAPDVDTPVQQIGEPCSGPTDCSSGLCIMPKNQSPGVCSIPCTPDDPETALVNEDGCPDQTAHICAADPNGSGGHYCYRRCLPKLGSNDCGSGLACRPQSSALTPAGSGQAICLYRGCQSDDDCPVLTSQSCSGGCVRCIDGRCAVAGKCDLASGLCAPRTDPATFKALAQVGDPCKVDADCGKAMRCEREGEQSGLGAGATCTKDAECCSGRCDAFACTGACRVHARNGYCLIEGCGHSSLLPAFGCPTGADCMRGYPGGWCLATCALTDVNGCRNNGADKLGDYECRAWQNLSIGGVTVSSGPVCEFGDSVPCDRFKSLDCSAVADDQANATQMRCRDAQGTVLVDPRDPRGYCLDNTGSGSWP